MQQSAPAGKGKNGEYNPVREVQSITDPEQEQHRRGLSCGTYYTAYLPDSEAPEEGGPLLRGIEKGSRNSKMSEASVYSGVIRRSGG